MQKLKLSTGESTLLDDRDFERFKNYKCFPATPRKGKYRYAQVRYEGKTQYLHRLILNAPKGVLVDHIDHDTLNNQRSNLRLVSQHGNQMNAIGRKNKTGFSNVRVLGSNFQGRVKVMGKKISVGCFKTPQEAFDAVRKFKAQRIGQESIYIK